ncbi:cytochrome b561 domain-containing protein At2g30890-like isoform X2 [Dioscorea cayenensis subsp. rotundata]|nr:cytochrome b561 domain-containing protein At2g30890-like isoform X2 [Dioscorea cayenensis subsp. rotundata]XP_039115720.1 cytochrome b561 domain-containing protein At2g30890-like isoform X2 [Dioscorea cayenensis subsp. rotundata]
MSVMLASFMVLLLPSLAASSVHNNHTNIQQNPLKLNSQLSFQIIFHAFLLWASLGFLMPVGTLVIRMSNTVKCGKKLKALYYCHVILQITAVFLALAAVILSIIHFENFFNNTHQRIGLALYVLIVIQPLVGFFRPQRGVKFRRLWYFVHWILGNGVCIVGIINIYIGLHAFHARASKNVRLWTILFTVEVCIIAFIYLLQDRWNYMQKQGVILGNEQITPTDHSPQNIQKDHEAEIP